MEQFARAPFESKRRTIDVSGDGTNNAGRGLLAAREDALAQGVTINGLVILSERPLPWNPEHTNPPGGLAKYFQDNVIGGPGAFVMVAERFQLLRPGHHLEADRRDRGSTEGRDDGPCLPPGETIGSIDPVFDSLEIRSPQNPDASIDKRLVSTDSRLKQSGIVPSY